MRLSKNCGVDSRILLGYAKLLAALMSFDQIAYGAFEAGRGEWRRRYRRTDKGRVQLRKALATYKRTKKGHLNKAKYRASQRGITITNYHPLSHSVQAGQESCYMCGELAEQVDHIIAVGLARLFGINADDYVGPICIRCHGPKSGADIQDIYRVKRELRLVA